MRESENQKGLEAERGRSPCLHDFLDRSVLTAIIKISRGGTMGFSKRLKAFIENLAEMGLKVALFGHERNKVKSAN